MIFAALDSLWSLSGSHLSIKSSYNIPLNVFKQALIVESEELTRPAKKIPGRPGTFPTTSRKK